MPRIALALFAAAAIVTLAPPVAAQHRAKADIVDMEDKDRALVAKEGIKQRRDNKRFTGGYGKDKDSSQCGSVDIGNDSNANKGSNKIAERNKTVIVTGNVINTASCK